MKTLRVGPKPWTTGHKMSAFLMVLNSLIVVWDWYFWIGNGSWVNFWLSFINIFCVVWCVRMFRRETRWQIEHHNRMHEIEQLFRRNQW